MPPTLPRLPYISPRPTAQIEGGYSPPRRGGEDAPSEAKAQTGWSDRRNVSAELTTNQASPYARASRPARQLLLTCAPPLLCEVGNIRPGGKMLKLDDALNELVIANRILANENV